MTGTSENVAAIWPSNMADLTGISSPNRHKTLKNPDPASAFNSMVRQAYRRDCLRPRTQTAWLVHAWSTWFTKVTTGQEKHPTDNSNKQQNNYRLTEVLTLLRKVDATWIDRVYDFSIFHYHCFDNSLGMQKGTIDFITKSRNVCSSQCILYPWLVSLLGRVSNVCFFFLFLTWMRELSINHE